ncbi:glycoside hydrolase family 78 protein, partial [Paenibacillus sp. y28]|uniref:glycoside hydrolase family 78 protein n=1 Tax=Paenibacillus sp. y28 TaxID=3129110 RepID=UPI00301B1E1F
TTTPTITWTQNDADGLHFTHYRLQIFDMDTGYVAYDSGEVAEESWSNWNAKAIPAGKLEIGKKYRVRVMVSDGREWSEWSAFKFFCVNSPPTVQITNPNGSLNAPTIINGILRPQVDWSQADKDRSYFKKFLIEIRDAEGSLVYQTGERDQNTSSLTNSFQVDSDLPNGVLLQARMKVTDEDETMWSEYSNTVWFRINLPPAAELTFPTGTYDNPTPGSPLPTITWSQSDPDPDTTFTKYRVIIRDESGAATLVDSGEVKGNTQTATGSYEVTTELPAGQKVQVTVMVWDEYTSSPWAVTRWMLTNRPPVADLDWNPKPVWEGDLVTITSLSTDPDGDPLSYKWTVLDVDNTPTAYTTEEFDQRFVMPGSVEVTLTVSDGYAEDSVTKLIPVGELMLLPEVKHTPDWLVIHREKGHQTEIAPKDFYSGEIFVVEAQSSPAPVRRVTAAIEAVGRSGSSLEVSAELLQTEEAVLFSGELFDQRFLSLTEGLPEGSLPVYFRMEYENGTVKEQEVQITIIGHVLEAVGVHRRH